MKNYEELKDFNNIPQILLIQQNHIAKTTFCQQIFILKIAKTIRA
jgi:hypothetical protein